MPELVKNEMVEARMEGYTSQGHGVCRVGGRAVFVPGALRGELWRVRIVRVSPSVAWGRGEELLNPSPDRVTPDCAAFPRCGGCALRHMSYPAELDMKLRRVNDAFRRIGKLKLTADAILPAEGDGLRRRKVIFNVGTREGRPVAGFYRARSHEIVPAERCPAVPEEATAAAKAVLRWMEEARIPAYEESPGRDGVRHIFYRSSRLTGRCVVTLVVSKAPEPGKLDALTECLRREVPGLSGLVLDVNPLRGNTVLAGEFSTVWGGPDLREGLCGLTFTLSPQSFFQVNPPQAEKLYAKALEYAAVVPGELALDLYCGTGTIGLAMASRGARVIGAEISAPAVENARSNAAANGLGDRCEFLLADAAQAGEELRRRGLRPAAAVVDPPRKGLAPHVIRSVAAMSPERVVYVSCDPGALARDLALFTAEGYCPAAATAVDMFPRTSHVETVVLMTRVRD